MLRRGISIFRIYSQPSCVILKYNISGLTRNPLRKVSARAHYKLMQRWPVFCSLAYNRLFVRADNYAPAGGNRTRGRVHDLHVTSQ